MIRHDSPAIRIWTVFIGFISSFQVVFALYFSGFDFPYDISWIQFVEKVGGVGSGLAIAFGGKAAYKDEDSASYETVALICYASCEFLFVVDILISFFTDYISDETYKPVRNVWKIASRYLKSYFWYDFIGVFPFVTVMRYLISGERKVDHYNYHKLFYLFKVTRAKKAAIVFNSQFFLSIVKQYYHWKLQRTIRDKEVNYGYFDPLIDYTGIMKQIRSNYLCKIIL